MALTLATFNMKDFFPQPGLGADVFDAKLAWTAKMLARMDADVVALQEVGPDETLEALLAKMPSRGGYRSPVMGTPDARGIRCALLSRAPVLEARVHTTAELAFPVFRVGDPSPFGASLPQRRGVVVARIDASALGEGAQVHVVVAHFKSRRAVPLRSATGEVVLSETPCDVAAAEVRSLVWRAAEALYVRGLVDDVLAREPDPMLALMGDFNDVLDSTTLRILMTPSAPAGGLSSCAELVPPDRRFSILHRGDGLHFDHILVTSPLRARIAAARILNDELREHGFVPSTEAKARAPQLPDPPPTTDSDHAPFVARFE